MKSSRGALFPLLIASFGVAAILALGAYRTLTAASPALMWTVAAVVVLYAAWILSEFRITTAETKRDTSDDQGTCERYAIARAITMLTALGFDSIWTQGGPWLPVGGALFLAGVGLRTYAIRTLGRNYSHRVRNPQAIERGFDIVVSGPYRLLRHPAYSGMLLAHVGILILFFNWFALVALVGVFVPVLVRRIRVEEAHLWSLPGYPDFASGRARLVPGVW
jgi:protein-S-isoprenylcysteine O-methyltransferase Ste14